MEYDFDSEDHKEEYCGSEDTPAVKGNGDHFLPSDYIGSIVADSAFFMDVMGFPCTPSYTPIKRFAAESAGSHEEGVPSPWYQSTPGSGSATANENGTSDQNTESNSRSTIMQADRPFLEGMIGTQLLGEIDACKRDPLSWMDHPYTTPDTYRHPIVVEPDDPFDILSMENGADTMASLAGSTFDEGQHSPTISSDDLFDTDTTQMISNMPASGGEMKVAEAILEVLTHPTIIESTVCRTSTISATPVMSKPRGLLQFLLGFLEIHVVFWSIVMLVSIQRLHEAEIVPVVLSQGVNVDTCHVTLGEPEDPEDQYKIPDLLVLITLICFMDIVTTACMTSIRNYRSWTSVAMASGKTDGTTAESTFKDLVASSDNSSGGGCVQVSARARRRTAAIRSWFSSTMSQTAQIADDNDNSVLLADEDDEGSPDRLRADASDSLLLQSATRDTTIPSTPTGKYATTGDTGDILLTSTSSIRPLGCPDIDTEIDRRSLPQPSCGLQLTGDLVTSTALLGLRLYMACLCVDMAGSSTAAYLTHQQQVLSARSSAGANLGCEHHRALFGDLTDSVGSIVRAVRVLPLLGLAIFSCSAAIALFDCIHCRTMGISDARDSK